MRNLLFVLLFISITVLGCGGNKSTLENCADELYVNTRNRELNLLKKRLKKKLKNNNYYAVHRICEKEREDVPKSFDAKFK